MNCALSRSDPIPPGSVVVSIGSKSVVGDWPIGIKYRSPTAVMIERESDNGRNLLTTEERKRAHELAVPGVGRTRHWTAGRQSRRTRHLRQRACGCGVQFEPRTDRQTFATRECLMRWRASPAGRASNSAAQRTSRAAARAKVEQCREERRIAAGVVA